MRPAGPIRGGGCRPVGIFAPPPLPIQVINIMSSHIVSITQVSRELQDVMISARSASQYLSTPIYTHGHIVYYKIRSERHMYSIFVYTHRCICMHATEQHVYWVNLVL